MEKTAGHILKSDTVKLQGRFLLNAEPTTHGPAKGKNALSAVPQVRIVENHPESAVIEVTCCCGAKTHIKCEYADVQTTNQNSNQTKTNNGENDNAS